MPTNLRALRKQLRMTQAELAAVLGISRKSIGEYERGQAPTPRQTMLATVALVTLEHMVDVDWEVVKIVVDAMDEARELQSRSSDSERPPLGEQAPDGGP